MLARSQAQDKVLQRDQYAVAKQAQMKENAKSKVKRKQAANAAANKNKNKDRKGQQGDGEVKEEGEEGEGEIKEADQPIQSESTEPSTLASTTTTTDSTSIPLSNALIPFTPDDTILLIGEGDFSFAVSILKSKKASRITPTCFDSEAEVERKYGQVGKQNIEFLRNFRAEQDNDDEEDEDDDEDAGENDSSSKRRTAWSCAPLFNIDATKLNTLKPITQVLARPSAAASLIAAETADTIRTPAQRARANANAKARREEGRQRHFDVVVFNFPHTGLGLKDQARSVRQHQVLLSGFLKTAQPLIKPGTGSIAVALFDGLPYSLWNLKALGKAQDPALVVRRSGVFHWMAFEGYRHRLTAGGEGDTTKAASTRSARWWVLERAEDSLAHQGRLHPKKKGSSQQQQQQKGKKQKRQQQQHHKEDSSDSE